MKKIILLICLLFMVTACKNESAIKETTSIIVSSNNTIEYGENKYISDFITIKNGTLVNPNEVIDYEELGTKDISFDYIDISTKTKTYSFSVNIVDTTIPYINYSDKYTYKKGKKIDILDNILCSDNYDRDLVCTLEGEYNNSKVGNYNLKISATDNSGNHTEHDIVLSIVESTNNNSNNSYKDTKDIIKNYKSDNTMIGIDVSSWQGTIDFNKVKSSGVDAVMIRMGFGHNSKGEITYDNKYFENYKKAKEAGLLVGIYFYSYATSTKEAIDQVNWIINNLNEDKLDLPIAFDWESWSKFDNYNLNIRDINIIANSFLQEVERNGYKASLYSSLTYLNHIWNIENYETWLAHYTDKTTYDKKYTMWQLTNKGKVDGINGYVDVNILYK